MKFVGNLILISSAALGKPEGVDITVAGKL